MQIGTGDIPLHFSTEMCRALTPFEWLLVIAVANSLCGVLILWGAYFVGVYLWGVYFQWPVNIYQMSKIFRRSHSK